jgi:hypothetical protein
MMNQLGIFYKLPQPAFVVREDSTILYIFCYMTGPEDMFILSLYTNVPAVLCDHGGFIYI